MALVHERIVTKNFGKPESHTLRAYLEGGGYQAIRRILGRVEPKEVVEWAKTSGLRGRGGAGFPAGLKWSFVPRDISPRYLAVNADEGEPGTFKDRALMLYDPHLLIEGTLICAYAVGIERAFIYIRGEFAEPWRRVEAALAEAYEAGYLGKDVLGSGFSLEVHTYRGLGSYICGEETGLLESLEGKRGMPRPRPPFPAVKGLYGKPTVINNVETLCCLPDIVLKGPEWFRSIGIDEKNTGTRMYCLSGHVERPGIYELPLGITLREMIEEHAGGVRGGKKLKAVIPGGVSAPLLTAEEADVRMDFDSLARAGSMGGSGGVIVMDETTCMVQAAYKVARFFEHESCGQCSVCREGTGWASQILRRIENGRGRPDDLDTLAGLLPNMQGNTICVLSDACSMAVGSSLQKFRAEYEAHIREGQCPLGSPYP
ncbi:MAG: NADH-quinone oxidoreductase subunit NuoF [Nitrospinota bacterium]